MRIPGGSPPPRLPGRVAGHKRDRCAARDSHRSFPITTGWGDFGGQRGKPTTKTQWLVPYFGIYQDKTNRPLNQYASAVDTCTRHSYHLFLMRIDAEEFGAPRAAILKALEAEGVPVSSGYALPLYRQPLFLNRAFGPYLPEARKRLNYAEVSCPNCEKICYEQGAWLEQSIFLGSEKDIEDVANAFEKVYEHRDELRKAVL